MTTANLELLEKISGRSRRKIIDILNQNSRQISEDVQYYGESDAKQQMLAWAKADKELAAILHKIEFGG